MTNEEAITLAKNIAQKEGWIWLEPIEIHIKHRYVFWGTPCWYIKTNVHSRGCNAWFQIDDKTATVIAKGFLPR